MKQWLAFKKTIQKSPSDILAHQTYLNTKYGTKLTIANQIKNTTPRTVKKKPDT